MNESYQLGSLLLDSREKYLRALCESWMYADGLNNEEEVKDFFNHRTDEQLVDELIDAWDIDESIDKEELIDAMNSVRRNVV